MAKIKQRNKVKGIRQLDRAAITSQRMKNAYIRTKTQAVQAAGDRQESASEYADSQVQNVTENVGYDVGSAVAAGSRLAANKAKQTIRERKEIKTAEGNVPPQPPNPYRPVQNPPADPSVVYSTIPATSVSPEDTSRLRRPMRQTNLRYSMAQYRAREEAYRKGIPFQAESIVQMDPPDRAVEQGRKLAVSKAKRSAEERKVIRQKERLFLSRKDPSPIPAEEIPTENLTSDTGSSSPAAGTKRKRRLIRKGKKHSTKGNNESQVPSADLPSTKNRRKQKRVREKSRGRDKLKSKASSAVEAPINKEFSTPA